MERLYHIQDSDRPMHVAADDWKDAIDRWKRHIAQENDMPIEEVDEPSGIILTADEHDWLP